MAIVFANNASSLLSVSIGAADTTIQLADSSAFPVPTGGDVFYVTLEDDVGDVEVVRCSGNNGSTTLTVDTGGRGVYGGAQAFTANVTRVECRLTKTIMDNFLQLSGGALTGNLNLNYNDIIDAVLSGSGTKVTAGEIYGVPLRGATGASGNEIAVNPDGVTRATAGGAAILVTGDDIVAELDTAGVIVLDSATVGVRIPSLAYLRVEGTASTDYLEFTHDDTDVNITAANATDLNITGVTGNVLLGAGIGVKLTPNVNANENVESANFLDFSFETQVYAAATTVNVDYQLGSYVTINMSATQLTNLNITDVPTEYAAVRFKIVQDATGGRSITNFPTGSLWANGTVPPVGSMAANAVMFIDMWTDNGGTNWYGGYSAITYS